MIPGIALTITCVIVSAVSQLLLKKSAQRSYRVWWREYVNLFVISGYALFLLTTILNIIALHYIPLTLSTALGTSVQIAVPILSYLFLHEELGKRKCIGMAIVALGIFIFAL